MQKLLFELFISVCRLKASGDYSIGLKNQKFSHYLLGSLFITCQHVCILKWAQLGAQHPEFLGMPKVSRGPCAVCRIKDATFMNSKVECYD